MIQSDGILSDKMWFESHKNMKRTNANEITTTLFIATNEPYIRVLCIQRCVSNEKNFHSTFR